MRAAEQFSPQLIALLAQSKPGPTGLTQPASEVQHGFSTDAAAHSGRAAKLSGIDAHAKNANAAERNIILEVSAGRHNHGFIGFGRAGLAAASLA